MNFLAILLVTVIGALPTFYLWAYIHEFSHLWMAKRLVGATETKISIHMPPMRLEDGSWRWARYQWKPDREVKPLERAAISLAPRIPNIVGVVAFPFFGLFNEWVAAFWFLLMGGGAVDFIVGSLGISERSDLKRAVKALDVSIWPFRFGAAVLIIYDIVLGLYFSGWISV
jgi:hypothetical protein